MTEVQWDDGYIFKLTLLAREKNFLHTSPILSRSMTVLPHGMTHFLSTANYIYSATFSQEIKSLSTPVYGCTNRGKPTLHPTGMHSTLSLWCILGDPCNSRAIYR